MSVEQNLERNVVDDDDRGDLVYLLTYLVYLFASDLVILSRHWYEGLLSQFIGFPL